MQQRAREDGGMRERRQKRKKMRWMDEGMRVGREEK